MSPRGKTTQSFIKHASDVAAFYGFRPMRDIEREHTRALGGKPRTLRQGGGLYSFSSSSALCVMRAVSRPQEPVLAFYATPSPLYAPTTVPIRELGEFGLQVIGTPESVGEIVILKTLATIAREWGNPVSRIRVNALGDRDSQQRFSRELGLYIRKHIDEIEESARRGFLDNPFSIYRSELPAARQLLSEAPRPMHFLSEKSRVHFRSVLEHLEHLGLPYELDDLLAGDERGPHTAFALDFEEGDSTIVAAVGGRYDEYLKRESRRKDSTGASAALYFRKKGVTKSHFMAPLQPVKPKIYFAQLGLRAKLQGLTVVDMLRTANIPVLQSFDASHLSSQLASAASLGVPFLLIMGQREALDGTVIVRSTRNSAQNIIPLSDIPRFLRTLR